MRVLSYLIFVRIGYFGNTSFASFTWTNVWSDEHNVWSDEHNVSSDGHNIWYDWHNVWSDGHNISFDWHNIWFPKGVMGFVLISKNNDNKI